MRDAMFWLLSFCGFAAVTLVCGLLAWPQLSPAWLSIREQIDRFRRMPPLVKLALIVFAGVFFVYGSVKPNEEDQTSGTNIVEIVEGGTNDIVIVEGGTNGVEIVDGDATNTPPMMLTMVMPFSNDQPPTVTPEDIARGWRLWEVRTNCNMSYAMPEGATLATNWWVRGAYEDVKPFDFGNWRFPFGTNEYSSLWAFTWGKIRFALADTNEIVAVGAPMSAVPYNSRLWTATDTNGARLVTWENFAQGRVPSTSHQPPITNHQLVSAQVELRTTGDFVTRFNDVETVYRRIDDFDWDGDGIVNWLDGDPCWWDGDNTGQEEWWRAYVDETVGTGLENGYYKLTATFPQDGFHRAVLTVGPETVVVAEPGEYVFLLEKGEDYEFDIEPFMSDVSFRVVDDIPLLASPLLLSGTFGWWSDWSIDGGELIFSSPNFTRPGHCRWMPTLQATPSIAHLGPGDSPQTFVAVLTDYAYSQSVQYAWNSDDGNVCFSDPNSEMTEISVSEMPRWRSSSVSVTATFGDCSLESTCSFSYGEHDVPQTTVELSYPVALLLNSNNVDSAKVGQVGVSFLSDIETNGTLRLYCTAGAQRVRMVGACTKSVTGDDSFIVDIEGVKPSDAMDDVSLSAEFAPDDGGEPLEVQATLTVVQVKDVVLPGAPADGLVISTGTSVAFDLDVVPTGAEELLSVIYSVRRLRGNGTYTDWEYAAGNYWGTDAIYNPSSGGIYQVQAFASLGAEAVDERYYVWEEDENREIGFASRGERKAFGVVSCQWQKDLRNCAKDYFGSKAYLSEVVLPAQCGFPQYPAGDFAFKCNIFVAHRIVEAGLHVPATRGGLEIPGIGGLYRRYPPLANDWASESYYIRCWTVERSFPEPGFIVADPDDNIGHVGIMDFDGYGISAGTDNVNRKFEARTSGIVKRKYIGEN